MLSNYHQREFLSKNAFHQNVVSFNSRIVWVSPNHPEGHAGFTKMTPKQTKKEIFHPLNEKEFELSFKLQNKRNNECNRSFTCRRIVCNYSCNYKRKSYLLLMSMLGTQQPSGITSSPAVTVGESRQHQLNNTFCPYCNSPRI